MIESIPLYLYVPMLIENAGKKNEEFVILETMVQNATVEEQAKLKKPHAIVKINTRPLVTDGINDEWIFIAYDKNCNDFIIWEKVLPASGSLFSQLQIFRHHPRYEHQLYGKIETISFEWEKHNTIIYLNEIPFTYKNVWEEISKRFK
jgi:hypothetical protein